MQTSRRASAAILATCLMGACSLAPPSPEPRYAGPPSGDFALEFAGDQDQAVDDWWESFGDPTLNRVVEAVLAGNFDLAEGVARVRQARERARIAVGARLPTVSTSLGVDEFDVPANAGLGAQLDELGVGADVFDAFQLAFPERLDLTTYTFGASFAYELDFWGRDRHATRAAVAEHLAVQADYRAARIGILAETVGTYLEVVDLRHQRNLTRELVGISREQATLAESGYERGASDVDDLYEARGRLMDARTELPRIEARLADAEARLWVLLGGRREDVEQSLPDVLPPLPPSFPLESITAGLLVQRPDVGAARERVTAARHRVGARRAEMLPSLSLSGSIGLMSAAGDQWFDANQWFKNLTVNLLAPVFEGGRRRGNVALAEASLEEAVAAFGRAVVTATNEVRATLAGLKSSAAIVALSRAHTDQAAAQAALQERRYVAGVGDYATFLAASRNHVAWRSALAAGRRDLGHARLALHRAIGGGWNGAATGGTDDAPPFRAAGAD